jgi:hypothetical protein
METLSFGIDCAPEGQNPQVTRSPIDQSPAAHLTIHDREHLSTIVNTAPRRALNCSRSNGNLFTLPWNPCSRSRGNSVHHRVEYALKLAAGRLDQLKAIVQEALLDYRDVIGPAEYPGYGRLCHSGDIPIDVMNKTIADDSKQYNDWLRR